MIGFCGVFLDGMTGLGPKFGSTGFGGLGLGLGTGTGLNFSSFSLIGFGAGFGFGAGGSGFGTLLVMNQAWLRPLWQFQKMTCL